MTEERQSEANRAVRFKVGVGEDFPLLEEDRGRHMDMRVEWNCSRGGWRREDGDRHPLPRVFYAAAAIAGFIALISLAVSYPLATLGAVVAVLLLAGGPRRRRSFDYRDWDGARRGRSDAV